MSKVELIQHTVMPTVKAMAKDAAKSHVSAPMAEATASAADALSAQGKAMVEMGKKPYIKPEMKVQKIECEDIMAESTYNDRVPGGGYDFSTSNEGSSYPIRTSSIWDEEW